MNWENKKVIEILSNHQKLLNMVQNKLPSVVRETLFDDINRAKQILEKANKQEKQQSKGESK